MKSSNMILNENTISILKGFLFWFLIQSKPTIYKRLSHSVYFVTMLFISSDTIILKFSFEVTMDQFVFQPAWYFFRKKFATSIFSMTFKPIDFGAVTASLSISLFIYLFSQEHFLPFTLFLFHVLQ